MEMTKQKKSVLGLISIIPLILFIISLWYHLSLFDGFFTAYNHTPTTQDVAQHTGELSWLYGTSLIASLGLLLYYVYHLARIKTMGPARKVFWIALLGLLVPISFLIFWFFVINREPRHVPVKEDIT